MATILPQPQSVKHQSVNVDLSIIVKSCDWVIENK